MNYTEITKHEYELYMNDYIHDEDMITKIAKIIKSKYPPLSVKWNYSIVIKTNSLLINIANIKDDYHLVFFVFKKIKYEYYLCDQLDGLYNFLYSKIESDI